MNQRLLCNSHLQLKSRELFFIYTRIIACKLPLADNRANKHYFWSNKANFSKLAPEYNKHLWPLLTSWEAPDKDLANCSLATADWLLTRNKIWLDAWVSCSTYYYTRDVLLSDIICLFSMNEQRYNNKQQISFCPNRIIILTLTSMGGRRNISLWYNLFYNFLLTHPNFMKY